MHSTYIDELDNDLLSCENLITAIDDPKWLLEYSKEDDDDGEGFFGTIWAFIKKIFSAIGGFFSRLFGGSDDEDGADNIEKKDNQAKAKISKATAAIVSKVEKLTTEQYATLLKSQAKVRQLHYTKYAELLVKYSSVLAKGEEQLTTIVGFMNAFYSTVKGAKSLYPVNIRESITKIESLLRMSTDAFDEIKRDVQMIKTYRDSVASENITFEQYLKRIAVKGGSKSNLVAKFKGYSEDNETDYDKSKKRIYAALKEGVANYKELNKFINNKLDATLKELKRERNRNNATKIKTIFVDSANVYKLLIKIGASILTANVMYRRFEYLKITNINAFLAKDKTIKDESTKEAAKESFSTLYTEENNIVNFIYKKDREDNYNKHLLHVQDIVNETLEHVSPIKYNLSTLTIDEVSPLSKSTYLKWHTTANLALSTLVNAIKDDNTNKELTCKDVATKLKSIGIDLSSDLSRFTTDTSKVCRTFTSLEAMIPVSAYKLAYKENDTDIEKLYVDTESTLNDLYLNLKNMNININTPNDAYLFKSLMHLVSVCSFTISELGNNMGKMYSY